MGLLDDVSGTLGEKASALKGEAEQAGLGEHVTDLVNGHAGGLQGLLQAFRDKGFGGLVSSWVSREKNQPITAEQIQGVLGNAKIEALAAKVGVSTTTVATGLAAVLPQVIDRMTPDGEVPAAAATPAAPTRPAAEPPRPQA